MRINDKKTDYSKKSSAFYGEIKLHRRSAEMIKKLIIRSSLWKKSTLYPSLFWPSFILTVKKSWKVYFSFIRTALPFFFGYVFFGHERKVHLLFWVFRPPFLGLVYFSFHNERWPQSFLGSVYFSFKRLVFFDHFARYGAFFLIVKFAKNDIFSCKNQCTFFTRSPSFLGSA